MIKAVEIPVNEVSLSVRFYTNLLKLELLSQNEKEAVLGLGENYIILKKSRNTGVDTGIYFGVKDPFEFHRRMVDEGIVFVRHPERGTIGVFASFRDPDVNVLHVVESKSRICE